MTHMGYIAAAYGFVAFVVFSLIVWILLDRRGQLKSLAKIDAGRLPQTDRASQQRAAASSAS